MNIPAKKELSRITRVVIFLVTVVSTEAGSNSGLYLAILVWLELDEVIALEQRILEYFYKS